MILLDKAVFTATTSNFRALLERALFPPSSGDSTDIEGDAMAALILALLEEHENARLVKTCLEPCGHEIFVVDTFRKALSLLNTKKIDLIISDVHLENGGTVFDFLRLVKNGQLTCNIPFILFSSRPTPMAKYLADGIRTTARHLGAAQYIEMEGFDAIQFQEQINSLLSEKKQTVVININSVLAKKIED